MITAIIFFQALYFSILLLRNLIIYYSDTIEFENEQEEEVYLNTGNIVLILTCALWAIFYYLNK